MTPDVSRYFAELFSELGSKLTFEERDQLAREIITLESVDQLSDKSKKLLEEASGR